MEQESGVAGSFIPLSEHEQRFYSGLRSLCQADTPGKLSSSKVAELFKASQLPPEALHRVTEVCGAKRLGYFGPPQFYVALKLLAAAQSGLPIHLESVTANLPLPRFVGLKNEPEMRYSTVNPPGADGQGAQSGSAPWTPADRSAFRHPEPSTKKEPRSLPRSPCSSPPRSPLTYRSYPHAKRRNGADAPSAYESKHSSRAVVQREQHSSPSSYGPKPAVEHSATARGSSPERLGQQDAVEPGDGDPWRITEEQLEYYTNQFRGLQPDLEALILGATAKNFFTKSKLPIPELSHIWELSDVDRDGALAFSEFCTAFHLIVARKNGYPLPESLPPTLRPGFIQQQEEDIPQRAEPLIVFKDAEPRPGQMDRGLQPRLAAAKQDLKEETCNQDVGVTRSATSPGERTLQRGAFAERPAEPEMKEPPHDLGPHPRANTRPRSYSSTSFEDAMKKAEEPPTPPPRPQKSHSRASSLDLNKLLAQGAQAAKSGWLLPPPALPPRPSPPQVARLVSEKTLRSSVQQPNFADFKRFRDEEESRERPGEQGPRSKFGPSTEDLAGAPKQEVVEFSYSQAPQKPVRRKYHPESQNLEATPPHGTTFPPPGRPAQKRPSRQKREIQMAIRKNKETNAVLTRLNGELQQQLKAVHQERVTLESQLELLRPLAST